MSLPESYSTAVASKHHNAIKLFWKDWCRKDDTYWLFALQAAVPAFITVDLLYAVRANFSYDAEGKPFSLPYLAISDLLLSPLVYQVARGVYSFHQDIKQYFRNELMQHEELGGTKRIADIAIMVINYVDEFPASIPYNEVQEALRFDAETLLNPSAAFSILLTACQIVSKKLSKDNVDSSIYEEELLALQSLTSTLKALHKLNKNTQSSIKSVNLLLPAIRMVEAIHDYYNGKEIQAVATLRDLSAYWQTEEKEDFTFAIPITSQLLDEMTQKYTVRNIAAAAPRLRSTVSNKPDIPVFDPTVVQAYKKLLYPGSMHHQIMMKSDDNEAALAELKYLQDGTLTKEGILLFSENPADIYPSAYTLLSIYDDTTSDNYEFEGPIFKQIIDVFERIKSYIEDEQNNIVKLEKGNRKVYPMKAIRELLANAISHRDYEQGQHPCTVRIHPDRIEISNPAENFGDLDLQENKPISIDQLSILPRYKNISLTRAISAIKIIEMEGSGIKTAVDDCRNIGAPLPVLEKTAWGVKLTLYPGILTSTKNEVDCTAIDSNTHYVLTIGAKGSGKTTFQLLMLSLMSEYGLLAVEEGQAYFTQLELLESGVFPAPTTGVIDTKATFYPQRKPSKQVLFRDIGGLDFKNAEVVLAQENIRSLLICPNISLSILLFTDLEQMFKDRSYCLDMDNFLQSFLSFAFAEVSEVKARSTANRIILIGGKSDAVDKSELINILNRHLPKTANLLYRYRGENINIFPVSVGRVSHKNGKVNIEQLNYDREIGKVSEMLARQIAAK